MANTFDSPINFVQLIQKCNQICIPMIQRDYAQGRETQSEIRDEFLGVLHAALTSENGSGSSPLNLDFIYGSTINEGASNFFPLDGQQRLTTLFLLHWYLAWKDGQLESFQAYFVEANSHSKFTYQTRRSTKDFFDSLATFVPEISTNEIGSIKDVIIDEPWYFRSWRFDTTVCSSLVMLDAVHERFCGVEQDTFIRLVDEIEPPITFQLLNLGEFNLNDDLYIKMNARGLPLTPFETFKARYKRHLEEQNYSDIRYCEDRGVSVADYFAIRMDTRWADFLWKHRDQRTNLFDKAAVNVFRVLGILSRQTEDSDEYVRHLECFRDKSIPSNFSMFLRNKWLDRNLMEAVFLMFDLWSAGDNVDLAKQLPDSKYFDENKMFEKVIRAPEDLDSAEIVQLTAYYLYLKQHSKRIKKREIQQWMRVVFNLSQNTVYDRPHDIRRSISGIKKIVSGISSEFGQTLNYLANPKNEIIGFREQQVNEERVKAVLLLRSDDDIWADLVYRAENHGYFRGQIEFLLDFSGILGEIKKAEYLEIDEELEFDCQVRFSHFLEIAESMFNKHGLKNLGENLWERAMLTIGDYLLPRRLNHSFLINTPTDPSSWKRLLRGGEARGRVDHRKKRDVLRELWSRLDEKISLQSQLIEIVRGRQDIELWRQELVNTPCAIQYCAKRMIRREESDGNIYLLSSTQMNGRNVELFTYCLYQKLLNVEFDDSWRLSYDEVVGRDDPGIVLTWYYDEREVRFKLVRRGDSFIVSYQHSDCLNMFSVDGLHNELSPELIKYLESEANFDLESNELTKTITHSEIMLSIESLFCQLNLFNRLES